MSYDLLLTGGDVVDGLGGPRRRADVGIRDGRIAAVGAGLDAAPDAAARIDATGRVVAPGFVDAHSHSDLTVLSDGRCRSKLAQGVTTELVGNCGFGPFPVSPPLRDAVALIDLDRGTGWDWHDLPGFHAAVDRARPALNLTALAGHIPLRLAADPAAVGRPLDRAGRDRLAGLAADALDAGAAGCSTGLMYPPALDADHAELAAIGQAVARRDRLFAVHMRNYNSALVEAVDEAVAVARETGCRLQVSHLAVAGRANWGSVARALERIDAARADGVDVMLDAYPYLAGSANLSQLLPTWAQEGGPAAMAARLREPSTRDRVIRELAAEMFLGWDEIEISAVEQGYEDALGHSVAEIGRRRGVDPAEAALDLIAAMDIRVQMVAYGRSEADMRAALTHPAAMIGSDGLSLDPTGVTGAGRPHPRSYGCYPRVVGQCVRDGLLTLERAVAMSTAVPADRIGLTDRGRVTPGAVADLVVFDPATVADTATYAEPARFPAGVETVVVAGAVALSGGRQHDDVRAGRFLAL